MWSMLGARVLAVLLGGVFVLISVSNWAIVDANRRNRRRRDVRYVSWVPAVGGLSGVLAVGVCPDIPLASWWWLPLLLDWGSLPGTVYSVIYWVALRRPEPGTEHDTDSEW